MTKITKLLSISILSTSIIFTFTSCESFFNDIISSHKECSIAGCPGSAMGREDYCGYHLERLEKLTKPTGPQKPQIPQQYRFH